jgi:hypothetical protein
MRAYRARRAASGLKIASHWVPERPASALSYSSHRLLEVRSLALHCWIARKISRDLALLRIPRENLRRWQSRHDGQPPRYISEWSVILQQPWPVIAAFITSFSEKAIRLRQSSPFAGVLSPTERDRIYEAFRA